MHTLQSMSPSMSSSCKLNPNPANTNNTLLTVPDMFPNKDSMDTQTQLSASKPTLSDVIHEALTDALVYVPSFHDVCINKLYISLSAILGKPFPNAGVLRSHSIEQAKLDIEDTTSVNYLKVPSIQHPIDPIKISDRSDVMSEYVPRTPNPQLLNDRPHSHISYHKKTHQHRSAMKWDYVRSPIF